MRRIILIMFKSEIRFHEKKVCSLFSFDVEKCSKSNFMFLSKSFLNFKNTLETHFCNCNSTAFDKDSRIRVILMLDTYVIYLNFFIILRNILSDLLITSLNVVFQYQWEFYQLNLLQTQKGRNRSYFSITIPFEINRALHGSVLFILNL